MKGKTMSASCGHDVQFDGTSRGYRRALYAAIALNAGMFAVEITAGALSGSQALRADALDFLADAVTYGLSLWVIGRPLALRAKIAMAKGISLLLMGLWVFGSTLWLLFGPGMPRAEVMGAVGALALMANLASVIILMRYRDGDANVRSVWLCSRNDAVGNVAVMGAALAVGLTATPWPDLLVAAVMSGLFLSSAWQIITRARREMQQPAGAAGHIHNAHDHGHAH
jgi:Co/Zn/Cd efflux system component